MFLAGLEAVHDLLFLVRHVWTTPKVVALKVADGLVHEGEGSGIDNGPPCLGHNVSAMHAPKPDRPEGWLRACLAFVDILRRRGEHLDLLTEEAKGLGQTFGVPREGKGYGR